MSCAKPGTYVTLNPSSGGMLLLANLRGQGLPAETARLRAAVSSIAMERMGLSTRRGRASAAASPGRYARRLARQVMRSRPSVSEYRAVGGYRNRRGAIGRTQCVRDFSPRAPGAALQQLRHGEARIQTQPFSHQTNQWVHQRDGERTPFDDELRADVVPQQRIDRRARADHAEIDEEAAVAIFGQRGELVQPLHGEPRRLER